jgi:hypothetical protein
MIDTQITKCPNCGTETKEPTGRHETRIMKDTSWPVSMVSYDTPREGPLYVQSIKRWGDYYCCQTCSHDWWTRK